MWVTTPDGTRKRKWAYGKSREETHAKWLKRYCCQQIASDRTIRDAWTVLCSALTNAVTEELIAENVAGLLKVSKPRRRKVKPWTVDEARRFPESAKRDGDPFYAAYVLILVLGLRKKTLKALKSLGEQLGS
ncbi:hypothetical protein NE235_09880 [Actinoallomurus spadix]|uniref:Integrase n=1 Tax=Actinoallomurus spadix TaxID=79912 RepID=A0ABN0WV38_9ACTN|nr:hypothetical protein [Actinoallomurus spadix]MCO5986415.1 hypothetical protein [Actinoallomurus spadix]